MIRIGLRTPFEFVPEAAGLGYDYLELPLTRIAALTDDEFEELAVYIEAAGVNIEAMYDMLPPSLRVNGPDVRARDQHAYLETAFYRAKRLGAQIIAFDAPEARHVPALFDFAMARRQTGNFLRIVQGHAVSHGLQVAIQNFRHAQCNLINTVSESALMAALLQLGQVGVLADTMQMAYAAEPLEALVRCGSSLMHVHAGSPLTRGLPRKGDGEDYEKLFRTLIRCGYQGRVSASGMNEYTVSAAGTALECLRYARREAGL
ncbi:MAG: sugar phosphate isomerase/epimerase [Clostridia bacterium]|nr:sugar phosphate isomerase/epimerase [Clostridia bacterium]